MKFILLFFIVSLAGCSGEQPAPVVPPFQDPVAVRQHDGSMWIQWQQAPSGRVQVFHSESPDEVRAGSAIGELQGGEFTATNLTAGRRPYFELVSGNGESVVVAERLLPLEGAHNFRDLGGYPTKDGRRIRWGRIYRSDHLGGLTDDDLTYLEQLGIRTVCDFRGPDERESDPDRLGASGTPRTVNPAISDQRFAVGEMQSKIISGDLDGLNLGSLLVDGNRAFARDYTEQYAQFLALFEDDANLPIVFHCTAGKDRAGFAAYLTLIALGVSEENALRDYMLTQPYTQSHIDDTLRTIRFVSLFRTDIEKVRPLMGVQAAYIRAAVDAVESDYGNLETYLDQALNFGPEKRAALQSRLLQ